MRIKVYTPHTVLKLSKRYGLFAAAILIIFSSVAGTIGLAHNHALALSGSQFQAGGIIDNGVFFDGSTMSSMDVQNFLSAKVPTCDTNGTQMYNSTQTRAQYGSSQGYPAPYTCLKDYRQDTPSMPAESGLCATFNSGNRSAAQIIHDVAASCGINSQVLLVLLQKEQSLVTDDWPWPTEYTNATGFGCPDTAPCDPSYGGFFYQVYYAAHQFKKYQRDASQYSYFANSNNNIAYNPSTSCGSSNIYLQNQATTNLYIYTPYQPNAAALANLYGTGDSCSSYGNRNFWRLFNDWFGSTHAAPFMWQPVSQEAYSDAAHTLAVNTSILSPNTTYYLRLRVQNMGNSIWHNSGGSANNQVNVATSNPSNRVSDLANTSWMQNDRPGTLTESTVFPGDYGTFDFSITTPSSYVSQNEYFNLVADGQTWMNDVGLYWPIGVKPPTPTWSAASQESYYDSARIKPLNLSALAPNTTYYMRIKALNIGNTTWSNSGSNPVRLGTSNPVDRTSGFYDSSWISQNRISSLVESSVAPGQTGTFEFAVHTPSSYGAYKEYFRPVVEGQAWMNDIGLYYPYNVAQPTYQWQLQQQSLYTDSSQSTAFDSSSTPNNTRFYAVIKARNTGNTTWTNGGPNPLRLGTSNPTDRTSGLYDSSWLSSNRPAILQDGSVAPGDVGTFAFWMQAPYASNGTTYKEYFRPVVEGKTWLTDIGMYIPVTMQSGNTLSWNVQSKQAFSDSGLTASVDTSQLKLNTVYWLRLKIKNTGGTVWGNTSSTPFRLGTSNPQNRTSVFSYNWLNSNRPANMNESSVIPGGTGTFTFTIKTPGQAASSNEYFQPVIDGVTWLPDMALFWAISAS